jgi:hypothetical protein
VVHEAGRHDVAAAHGAFERGVRQPLLRVNEFEHHPFSFAKKAA